MRRPLPAAGVDRNPEVAAERIVGGGLQNGGGAVGRKPHHAGSLGAHPQRVVCAALDHRNHDGRTGERLPTAGGVLADEGAARAAGDESSTGVDVERAKCAVLQHGDLAAVEGGEGLPVVADQAFPRGEPQIALGRLRDGVDGVVRQAVPGGPVVAEQVLQRAVHRRCLPRREHDDGGQQGAAPSAVR